MSGKRTYFQTTIGELERLVEEQRHDRTKLRRILAELQYRDTDRAKRLRRKIRLILDGLELDLAPAPHKPHSVETPEVQPVSPPRPDLIATKGASPENSQIGATARQEKGGGIEQPDLEVVAIPASPKPSEIRPDNSRGAAARDDQQLPLIVSRMIDLIDYVIAVEKDKLKIVTDVADHRGFHRTYDELAALPGVSFNRKRIRTSRDDQLPKLVELARLKLPRSLIERLQI